jgi:hypothetical protein
MPNPSLSLAVLLTDDDVEAVGALGRALVPVLAAAPDTDVVVAVAEGLDVEGLTATLGVAAASVVVAAERDLMNAALGAATSELVTFVEPGEELDDRFVGRARRAWAELAPEAVCVVTPLLRLAAGRESSRGGPDQVADLVYDPHRFPHRGVRAVYRRADLADAPFDVHLPVRSQEEALVQGLLLAADQPLLGLATSPQRWQSQDAPAARRHAASVERLTSALERGVVEPLAAAVRAGAAPEWLQVRALDVVYGILRDEGRTRSPLAGHDPAVATELLALIDRVLGLVDDEVLEGTRPPGYKGWMRDLLLLRASSGGWLRPQVTAVDDHRDLVCLTLVHTGDAPEWDVAVKGARVDPIHATTRTYSLVGQVVMHEQIRWYPAGSRLKVLVDGRPARIDLDQRQRVVDRVRPTFFSEVSLRGALDVEDARRRARARLSRRERLELALSRTRVVRRLYGRAWVVMDRPAQANDNGEVFARWLREHRPRRRSYFVIGADAPDRRRLRRETRLRLVVFGSLRWRLLMLTSPVLVSSHAGTFVTRPQPYALLSQHTRAFVFLQHGVLYNDLSRWLNNQEIDALVTSSPGERDAIVSTSPYRFSSKEVVLTGMPRHDALLEAAARQDRPRWLLVAPTWRVELLGRQRPGSDEREVLPGFAASEYVRRWRDALNDPRLRALAEAHGLTIGFLPHPNFQPLLDEFALEPHVQPLSYAEHDIRELLAGAAVLVTDYSSIAFDMGYLGREVVYYQFDKDEFFGGGHTVQRGYFDIERDGFGPVVTDHEALVSALTAAVERGEPDADVRERIAAAFPLVDGQACERVHQVVSRLVAGRNELLP